MLKVPSPYQLLCAFLGFERPFDLARMEEDGRVAIALQHLVLHAFVAGRVSALAGGRVDQNFSLGHAGSGIEKELSALQLEGAMGGVQTAVQLPVNFGLRRVELRSSGPGSCACASWELRTTKAAMMLDLLFFSTYLVPYA